MAPTCFEKGNLNHRTRYKTILGSTKPDTVFLLIRSTLSHRQRHVNGDLLTVSCALSSATGSLTSESQGNKLFLTSRSGRRKRGLEKPKMVMRGSSVREDEPLLENGMNDLQGLYGREQPAS